MAGRGNPEKGSGQAVMPAEEVSAAQWQQYLKGAAFPANKQDLIRAARTNNAPDNIITMMNRLPDKTYSQSSDVEMEFSKTR